ncbi:MAG: hypothetical protein RSH78_05850 [Bacilli bacterium]
MELTEYKDYPLPAYYKGIMEPPEPKLSKFDDNLQKVLKDKRGYLLDIKKKYDYPKMLMDMLELINVALLEDNNKDIDYLFYQALNDVEIVVEARESNEIFKDYNIYGPNEDCSGMFTLPSPIFNKYDITYQQSKILIGLLQEGFPVTRINFLDTLTHELKHAINSINNSKIKVTDKMVYIRSGIAEFFMTNNGMGTSKSDLLDEVFNVYFTEKIIDQILSYKFYNLDNEFLKRIHTRDITRNYFSEAYTFERELVYPLTQNKELLEIIKQACLSGELETLKQFFPINYNAYNKKLDSLSEQYGKYLDYCYLNKKQKFKKNFEENIEDFKEKTLQIAKQ